MIIKRNRQTKILATLGPASGDIEVIEKLLRAGVDIFRLNFSHGSHEDHKKRLDIIRALEEKYNHPIAILADMQGPKLRVGRFKEGQIKLTEGMKIRLDLDETLGDETRVCLPHPEVINNMPVDSEILLDDGKVRMKIVETGKEYLIGEIISGSKLSDNKGFNIPGVILPIEALTPKDLRDIDAALEMGVDWIAQSFVQKPEDVKQAREIIGNRAHLMIKIEKPSALEYLDEMIDLADGVMIARGDLGVEIPPENVPAVQKKIIRKVRAAGKPVVVATQMLESMIENARPTRAEASDVATAVYDGTDAVMLSAETAAGKYPVESVKIMDNICEKIEHDELYRPIMDAEHPNTEDNSPDAITTAAHQVAEDINASCIVTYTTTGGTALRAARQRPDVPVLCLTQDYKTARYMCLSYGVRSIVLDDVTDFDQTVDKACEIVKKLEFAKKGENIVMTAGVPFGTPGSTNNLRIAWIN